MDELLSKPILMFGNPCMLCCDGKCNKAWGINNRPRVYLQGEDIDPDDYAFLADGELGDAPIDPGTYEGEHGKPQSIDERLNKWCARECERSQLPGHMDDLELPDFSVRQYNIAPHVRT